MIVNWYRPLGQSKNGAIQTVLFTKPVIHSSKLSDVTSRRNLSKQHSVMWWTKMWYSSSAWGKIVSDLDLACNVCLSVETEVARKRWDEFPRKMMWKLFKISQPWQEKVLLIVPVSLGFTRRPNLQLQICRKICGLGCVTRALVPAVFTQPSPHIFLHFCIS